jgi:endonuclease III
MAETDVVRLLRQKGQQILDGHRLPYPFTGVAGSDALLNDLDHHSHAFVLASVMDRQMNANRAWLIPYLISEKLGTFDIGTLKALRLSQIRRLMTKPAPLHRFSEEMSINFHAAIRRICGKYGGNAANIWNGTPPSATVVYRFLEFRGAGPKIATMAANLLVRCLKIPLSDYYSIDVSVDVQVRRVLLRLGIITPDDSNEQVVYRVRGLLPDFPGIIDSPAWEVGRTWCRPIAPKCTECYMTSVCPTASRSTQHQGSLTQ